MPLLLERGRGLIVEITDGDHTGYRGALFYDLAKTQVMRLAFALATELRNTDITVIAVTPGFLRDDPDQTDLRSRIEQVVDVWHPGSAPELR